jgi:hypothetical protein
MQKVEHAARAIHHNTAQSNMAAKTIGCVMASFAKYCHYRVFFE